MGYYNIGHRHVGGCPGLCYMHGRLRLVGFLNHLIDLQWNSYVICCICGTNEDV